MTEAVVTNPGILPLSCNPRYANYARVHGNDPDRQIDIDRARWPGGSMCGFTLWNRARLQEYGRINPDAFYHFGAIGPNDHTTRPAAILDHNSYDAWLDALPVGHGVDDASPERSRD